MSTKMLEILSVLREVRREINSGTNNSWTAFKLNKAIEDLNYITQMTAYDTNR